MWLRFVLLGLLASVLSLPVYAEDEEAEGEEAAASAKVETSYIDLQPAFVTNYGGPGRLRFLRAEVSVRVEVGKEPAVLRHMPAIRDKLIMLLSRQTDDAVSTMEGKELMRQDALLAIQEFLNSEEGEHGVRDLLFAKFVVQR